MMLTIRPAAPAERLYAYGQSMQIAGQCGSPGYLRGGLDNTSTVFVNSWEQDVPSQNTPEFKAEFNTVLDMLRFDERYGCALKNRTTLIAYCLAHPEAKMENTQEYAFRADTEGHSYLIRCTPSVEFDHVFIHPYNRQWLDHHMKQAEKGIRFITSDYEEKFRIADGEHIRIFTGGGETLDRIARYIDDYHVELVHEWGSNIYHICEFAERLEQTGGRVIPMRSSLPDKCYCVMQNSNEIIIIKKGESGYYSTEECGHDSADAQRIADEYNGRDGVSRAQAAAMLAGSMFGWEVPAADPKNYDSQGLPVKPKRRAERDAR